MSRRAELLVSNPAGLHARPAGRLVEHARRFESDIALESNGRRGNAKSLVSVLKLGISKDTTVWLDASGPDEDAAITELSALIASLGEEK